MKITSGRTYSSTEPTGSERGDRTQHSGADGRCVLSTTGLAAIVAGVVLALVLSVAGSSPAFAVTRNPDGSYSLTLRALSAIPAANAKLARIGVPARFVQVRARCTTTASLPGNTPPFSGAAQRVRIPAHALPQNRLLVIPAWRKQRQVRVASSLSRTAAACVPPCSNSLPPFRAGKAVTVRVPAADGGFNSGNSGNSGKGGNSGNSDNSGKALSRTSQPPAKSVQIQCAAPSRGAGNSGNSGSGNSGNS